MLLSVLALPATGLASASVQAGYGTPYRYPDAATGWDTPGDYPGSPNLQLLLFPPSEGRATPVVGLAYWLFRGTLSCAAECPDFTATTHAAVLSGGLRYRVGPAENRRYALHLEAAPALVFLHHRISRPPGEDEPFLETHREVLLGFRLAAAKSIWASGSRRIDLGVNYLWTAGYRGSGDDFFHRKRRGLSQVGVTGERQFKTAKNHSSSAACERKSAALLIWPALLGRPEAPGAEDATRGVCLNST
jgi:hypothetical protein